METPQVLAFAFACEPGRGSEPGVGFAFARALAALTLLDGTDVTLLTRPHRADQVVAHLDEEFPGHRVQVERVAIPMWLVSVTKRAHVRFAYLVWQWRAVERARALVADAGRPIVAHHITFASDVMTTFEGRLPARVGRVFGPAGSSQVLNRQLWSRKRVLLDGLLRRVMSRPNLKGVDVMVCQNEQVADQWRGRIPELIVEPNILLAGGELAKIKHLDRDPHGIAVMGLLIERKQPEIAIRALAQLPGDYWLQFIGDGPLKADLVALARDLGVADRVKFSGDLTHLEALEALTAASFLLHPSRQEGAGWVVGEAQTVGAWPIAIQGSGADSTIHVAGIGTVVPSGAPEQVAARMARAVLDRAGQPAVTTSRWDGDRLPEALQRWYATALTTAGARQALAQDTSEDRNS